MLSHNNYPPYRPLFFDLNIGDDKEAYERLIQNPTLNVFDTIIGQIKELVKLRTPNRRLTPAEYEAEINQFLNGKTADLFGIWVYYEWSNTLVHTLNKSDFIDLRTSRNQYKITKAERDILGTKKIGIAGLSVGSSIAMTLATERVCGELRLADFDTLELSNLNRLRTGIHNLGVPKVVIAAREIAEIDPFLDITIFPEGLTEENIDLFFGEPGNRLDVFVEVCDGIDMKIISRHKAKKLHIPVVMDTNDRGMIDIERFDLEPERPILHGLAGDLNPANIKGLTNEEKIPYILKMVGAESISTRLKASMIEVDQTLNTWPQLASSVQLGGAATTDVCRRILLNQLTVSGRYYIDLDAIIPEPQASAKIKPEQGNPFKPLTVSSTKSLVANYLSANTLPSPTSIPSAAEIDQLMDIAIIAPSAGNNQPWKWTYTNGRLILLHDRYRSWSWGDYAEMGALMGLGTAIESVVLYAQKLGYKALVNHIDAEAHPFLVADITFEKPAPEAIDKHKIMIADNLIHRHTNRADGNGQLISKDKIAAITGEIAPYRYTYLTDKNQLHELGRIIASCDRLRLLHEQGHEEFFHEIRWNKEEATKNGDGIEIASVDLTEADKAGFVVAKDYNAIQLLYEWNLGNAFKKLSLKSMQSAAGFCIISIPEFNRKHLLEVGGSILRAWTVANQHNITLYPMLSPAFFFNRLNHGKGSELPPHFIHELKNLYTSFKQLDANEGYPAFMFRLAYSDTKALKTLRMEKQSVFIS